MIPVLILAEVYKGKVLYPGARLDVWELSVDAYPFC